MKNSDGPVNIYSCSRSLKICICSLMVPYSIVAQYLLPTELVVETLIIPDIMTTILERDEDMLTFKMLSMI